MNVTESLLNAGKCGGVVAVADVVDVAFVFFFAADVDGFVVAVVVVAVVVVLVYCFEVFVVILLFYTKTLRCWYSNVFCFVGFVEVVAFFRNSSNCCF